MEHSDTESKDWHEHPSDESGNLRIMERKTDREPSGEIKVENLLENDGAHKHYERKDWQKERGEQCQRKNNRTQTRERNR